MEIVDLVRNELAAVLWSACSAVMAADTSVSTGVVVPIVLAIFAAFAGLAVLSLDSAVGSDLEIIDECLLTDEGVGGPS